MPLYAFRCADGHEVEQLCKLDLSDAPKRCMLVVDGSDEGGAFYDTVHCGKSLERVMTAPASIFPKADSWRK